MTYTPTPGSIAHRAIEHLRSLGVPVSIVDLSEQLGVGRRSLNTALVPAFEGKVVFREARRSGSSPRGWMFWWAASREVFGVVVKPPEPDDNEDTMPIVRRVIKAGSVPPPVTRAARSVFEVVSQ